MDDGFLSNILLDTTTLLKLQFDVTSAITLKETLI